MGSTYLTMKMIVAALLMLMVLINGVQMEDPLVADSSGDGESIDLKSPVSLIDDNGDIQTESPATVDIDTNVSVKTEMDNVWKSTFTTVTVNITETISESFSTTSTAAPTEVTVATTTQSTQTNPPTTQSTKPDITTSMPEVTTVTTTTSTTIPSSVADEVTTEAEMETSTLSSEATEPEKMDKSTESTPKRSTTESTVLTPAIDRSVCTFVEEDFTCRDELICYGQGEIDCTDYDDEDPGVEADAVKQVSTYNAKSNMMGKNDERPLADAAVSSDIRNVKSSAKAEDYTEYDDESDVIETYPPSLVGVASHKRIPFILRPLASTEVSPNATDEIPTTATTRTDEAELISTTTTVHPENKDLMENALTTVNVSATENMEGSDAGQGLVSQPTTAAESASATPELSESNSNLTSADTLTANENIAPNNTNNTVSNDEEIIKITTESDKTLLTFPSTTPFKELLTEGRRRIIRKKRQENFMELNSSSSQSQTFQVAALESTQRKLRVKVCRLSGDIVCTPTPTVTMCKGKSYCQAISSTADTTESATTRGVETWAIIVIVVCALSGFLTICLLIYLVVTSCKKLKVQPSIEVTTLNYINRGASTNEVA